ncbi:MAG: hypothetical protein PHE17_17110 [Thiothrix sp.]|jgi:hypothetical protein|uniref:hypothetical protein n=1 Tax=Thiothrix sp. TaxID=1032 RepID=UPI0026356BDB|nr:hypothetical protein [Thiothrix sp.]MDD5394738.1 hypothetical protein [Thiothrix sp.]
MKLFSKIAAGILSATLMSPCVFADNTVNGSGSNAVGSHNTTSNHDGGTGNTTTTNTNSGNTTNTNSGNTTHNTNSGNTTVNVNVRKVRAGVPSVKVGTVQVD